MIKEWANPVQNVSKIEQKFLRQNVQVSLGKSETISGEKLLEKMRRSFIGLIMQLDIDES